MEIIGRLVASNTQVTYPVAIVTSSGKEFGVAVIVADPEGTTDNIDFANACISLLGTAANRHGLFGNLHKVELTSKSAATARVEMTLASADDGDTIVFMCADATIFDGVWRGLNVRK